jgi:hypothetical protein
MLRQGVWARSVIPIPRTVRLRVATLWDPSTSDSDMRYTVALERAPPKEIVPVLKEEALAGARSNHALNPKPNASGSDCKRK